MLCLLAICGASLCDHILEIGNVQQHLQLDLEQGETVCVNSSVRRSVVALGEVPPSYSVIVRELERDDLAFDTGSIFTTIESPASFEIKALAAGSLTFTAVGLALSCIDGISISSTINTSFSETSLPIGLASAMCYMFAGFRGVTAEFVTELSAHDAVDYLCGSESIVVPNFAHFEAACEDGAPPFVRVNTSTFEVERRIKFRANATGDAHSGSTINVYLTPRPVEQSKKGKLTVGIVFGSIAALVVFCVLISIAIVFACKWVNHKKRTLPIRGDTELMADERLS